MPTLSCLAAGSESEVTDTALVRTHVPCGPDSVQRAHCIRRHRTLRGWTLGYRLPSFPNPPPIWGGRVVSSDSAAAGVGRCCATSEPRTGALDAVPLGVVEQPPSFGGVPSTSVPVSATGPAQAIQRFVNRFAAPAGLCRQGPGWPSLSAVGTVRLTCRKHLRCSAPEGVGRPCSLRGASVQGAGAG